MTSHRYFCPCPRGLEPVLVDELVRLRATKVLAVPGGAEAHGDLALGYAINLWSRVASRVLRHVAQGAYRNEDDVYALARSIDWPRHFDVGRSLRVDVTGIDSPLKSLDFITLRVKDAVCDRFRDALGARPNVDTKSPDVRVSAFLTADSATLYLDLSGEPLFKRGYRRERKGDAPIRENLAAGLLALAGYTGEDAFFDPMCGSGTLVIEAALIARNMAPGRAREFGFERLADFDAAAWARLQDAARRGERPSRAPLVGTDRAAPLVALARENAQAAGVAAETRFDVAEILEVSPPADAGLAVCNPPYGVRQEEADALAAFYPQLGAALKARFAGWRCWFITSDLRMPKLMRLKESKRTPIWNGALECRFFEFRMVAGSNRPGVVK